MATEPRSRHVDLRVPPELRDRLFAAAGLDRRSVNAEAIVLLGEALDARDAARKKRARAGEG